MKHINKVGLIIVGLILFVAYQTFAMDGDEHHPLSDKQENLSPEKKNDALSTFRPLWETSLLVKDGRLDAIAYCGDGIVLAGSRDQNPGRLFRSSDYGRTWAELPREGRAMPEDNITCIAPGKKSIVYLCTGEAHIWKSEDEGLNWADLGKVSYNTRLNGAQLAYGLTVLPTGTVLMSDTNASGGHVFRSVDAGVTWTDIGAVSPQALYRFEKTSDGVIVNGWGGHIYKSKDDGCTWTDTPITDGALFATETLGGKLLLQGAANGHVFRSSDNGETWEDCGKIGDAADDFVYIGNGVTIYSTYAGNKHMFLSTDHGLSWTSIGPVPTGVTGDVLDHVVCIPDSPDGPVAVGGTLKGHMVRISNLNKKQTTEHVVKPTEGK